MCIHFWERESVRTCEPEWGRAEREGDTESEAGSGLHAVSTEPDVGLEPMGHEIMTWAEVGCLTDWATQAPQWFGFKKSMFNSYLKLYPHLVMI